MLLSKNDIKVSQDIYIDQIAHLLSHKDSDVKLRVLETLTLSQDLKELALYLSDDNFVMEKILSGFLINDIKIKKAILNLLQLLLTQNHQISYNLISKNMVEEYILEEIQKNLPKGKTLEDIMADMGCTPELEILNTLNQVQHMIISTKEIERRKSDQ